MALDKGVFDDNPEWKEQASKSVCVLPISVGQLYHVGDEWKRTIAFINKYFAGVILVPVDELHGYTERIKNPSLSQEAADQKAKTDGDEWVKETKEKNKRFARPYLVTRWSEWTSMPHQLQEEQSETGQPVHQQADQKLVGFPVIAASIMLISLCRSLLSTFLFSVLSHLNSQKTAPFNQYRNKIQKNYSENMAFKYQLNKVMLAFLNSFTKHQVQTNNGEVQEVLDLDVAAQHCKHYLFDELAFIRMLAERVLPPTVMVFLKQKGLPTDQPFFVAYPFGRNSTNQSVFACFEGMCQNQELIFINLTEKVLKKNNKAEKKSTVTQVTGSVAVEDCKFPTGQISASQEKISRHVNCFHDSAAAGAAAASLIDISASTHQEKGMSSVRSFEALVSNHQEGSDSPHMVSTLASSVLTEDAAAAARQPSSPLFFGGLPIDDSAASSCVANKQL